MQGYVKGLLMAAAISMSAVAFGCAGQQDNGGGQSGAYGYRGAEAQSSAPSDPNAGSPPAHPGSEGKGGALGGSQDGTSGGNPNR